MCIYKYHDNKCVCVTTIIIKFIFRILLKKKIDKRKKNIIIILRDLVKSDN